MHQLCIFLNYSTHSYPHQAEIEQTNEPLVFNLVHNPQVTKGHIINI